jgi:hypothetical protein
MYGIGLHSISFMTISIIRAFVAAKKELMQFVKLATGY